MMKKYLMIIIFTMGLSLIFAQTDSVEVKFQDYLTKVDDQDSLTFEGIKKVLELPSAQNSLEMLTFANSIDPNAKWKLVGRIVERWESLPIYELVELHLEVESSKLYNPMKERKPKRTEIYAPISENNSFNSEFLFDVFKINEQNDFRKENVTAIPQIHPFTSWKPYYYQDLLILKKQVEYIGQLTKHYKTFFYYFRNIENIDSIKLSTQNSFADLIPKHFPDSAKIETINYLVNKIDQERNLVLKEIIVPIGQTYTFPRGDSIIKLDTASTAYAFFRNDSLVKYVEGDYLLDRKTSVTKNRIRSGIGIIGPKGIRSYYFYKGQLIFSKLGCTSPLGSGMCNSGSFSFSSYFYDNILIGHSLEKSKNFFSNITCPCSFEYDQSRKIMNSENSEYANDVLKRVDRIKTLVNP